MSVAIIVSGGRPTVTCYKTNCVVPVLFRMVFLVFNGNNKCRDGVGRARDHYVGPPQTNKKERDLLLAGSETGRALHHVLPFHCCQ